MIEQHDASWYHKALYGPLESGQKSILTQWMSDPVQEGFAPLRTGVPVERGLLRFWDLYYHASAQHDIPPQGSPILLNHPLPVEGAVQDNMLLAHDLRPQSVHPMILRLRYGAATRWKHLDSRPLYTLESLKLHAAIHTIDALAFVHGYLFKHPDFSHTSIVEVYRSAERMLKDFYSAKIVEHSRRKDPDQLLHDRREALFDVLLDFSKCCGYAVLFPDLNALIREKHAPFLCKKIEIFCNRRKGCDGVLHEMIGKLHMLRESVLDANQYLSMEDRLRVARDCAGGVWDIFEAIVGDSKSRFSKMFQSLERHGGHDGS